MGEDASISVRNVGLDNFCIGRKAAAVNLQERTCTLGWGIVKYCNEVLFLAASAYYYSTREHFSEYTCESGTGFIPIFFAAFGDIIG